MFSCVAHAQEGTIRVLDAHSKAPLEFVHLIFTDAQTGKQYVTTTDVYGKAQNLAQHTSQLLVTFISYKDVTTTVEPGKDYAFNLELGTQGLQEVVVTGQYAPSSEANSVYKIKVLSLERIQERGAVTLDQVLNTQLNLRLSQDNVLGTGINIQGLGGNNVKYLLDGVPIAGRLGGDVDLSQINLENIARIEIVEGPMSVMYGSNALAGTINLITKTPSKNSIKYGAKGYYESVGLTNLDAWVNLGGKKDVGKLILGRNFFSGWDPVGEGRSQQWNQKEQYFGNAAYDHEFKTWKLGFMVDGLWEQIKDKGDRRSEYSNYAFDYWYTTKRIINTVKVDVKSIKNHRLNILGSYTWFDRTKLLYNRDLVNLTQELTENPSDHDTTTFHTGVIRGTLSSGFNGKWNYQTGLDLNYEVGTGGRIVGSPSIGDYALFGSVKWQPIKTLTVQPSVRLAYNTDYSAPIVPSVNLQYQGNENWQIRLSYAHGFRAPSLKELHLEFVDANHNIFGNTNLTAERSRHVHAFFTWNRSLTNVHRLRIEPSVFYNNIQDMISLVQINGTYFTYENIDEYTTFGGKVEASYYIHPDFDVMVGYSYLGYSSQVSAENGFGNYQYSPEFVASFNYWRAKQKFKFNVFYKYTGAVPSFALDDAGEVVQTQIEAFSMLDITASYSFWKNRFALSCGAKNIFDVQNLQNTAAGGVHSGGSRPVSWGRTYFVGLKFSM